MLDFLSALFDFAMFELFCLHDHHFHKTHTVTPPGRAMYQYARCRFCDEGYEIVKQEAGA